MPLRNGDTIAAPLVCLATTPPSARTTRLSGGGGREDCDSVKIVCRIKLLFELERCIHLVEKSEIRFTFHSRFCFSPLSSIIKWMPEESAPVLGKFSPFNPCLALSCRWFSHKHGGPVAAAAPATEWWKSRGRLGGHNAAFVQEVFPRG